MAIKIGERVFEVPDSCPIDGPTRRRLVRHLRDHGPESLLTSKTLAPYSQCVLSEILDAGGEQVIQGENPSSLDEVQAQPCAKDA